jgi:hypothetical protein
LGGWKHQICQGWTKADQAVNDTGMIMERKTNGEMDVITIDADRDIQHGHVALHDPVLQMKVIGYKYITQVC